MMAATATLGMAVLQTGRPQLLLNGIRGFLVGVCTT
jgi:hypothetical protein